MPIVNNNYDEDCPRGTMVLKESTQLLDEDAGSPPPKL